MKIQPQHREDSVLRDAVFSQFDVEPDLLSTLIGVTVQDAVVSLTGLVNTYAQRVTAEKAAKRVCGVKAVANDLRERVVYERSAMEVALEIAKDAVRALETRGTLPDDRVKLTVLDGWVTLDGSVDLESQRDDAERAIQHVRGVKGVTNLIEVAPDFVRTQVKTEIEEAFQKSNALDARRIIVDTTGGTVRLGGHAGSLAEKKEAERVAWAARGVRKVENYVLVVR